MFMTFTSHFENWSFLWIAAHYFFTRIVYYISRIVLVLQIQFRFSVFWTGVVQGFSSDTT